MENKISFTTDDGEKMELYVIEEAKINGSRYLLVSESEDEDEAMAYIMKETGNGEDQDLLYSIVEDDKELNAVAGLFEEMLDGEVELVPDQE